MCYEPADTGFFCPTHRDTAAIARKVAKVHKYEAPASRNFISRDLLEFRRVNRTLNDIGLCTFLKLAKLEKDGAYRILHLPTSSVHLSNLKDVFVRGAQPLSELVEDVVYTVMAGDENPPDFFNFLHTWENMMMDAYFEDEEESDPDRLYQDNLLSWRSRCNLQSKFAATLSCNEEHVMLCQIFEALPRLRRIRIEAVDFWDELVQGPIGTSEDKQSSACAYGIPALISAISVSQATELELYGFGAFSFGSFHPAFMAGLTSGSSFAFPILTSLFLDVTHRDNGKLNFEGYDEDRIAPLSRADRVNLLLLQMPNLRKLSIACSDSDDYDFGESDWLRDALQGLRFLKLNTLDLRGFECRQHSLQTFLSMHRDSLQELNLTWLKLKVSRWLQLIVFIRGQLNLSRATVDLTQYIYSDMRADASSGLKLILEQHGGGYRKSDLGNYVVKVEQSRGD